MADSKKYNGSTWEHSLRKLTTATEAVENPLYSDGAAITAYTIKGNTVQNGTPTPSNPAEVNGVGDKTANIFDDTKIINIPNLGDRYGFEAPSGTYSIYNDTDNNVYSGTNNWTGRQIVCTPHSIATIQLDVGVGVVGGFFMPLNSASQGGCTIVEGSTPPDHFIPYGYKIPILSGGVTTNIYLGNTQITRRIKKLVLDGTENITSGHLDVSLFNIPVTGYLRDLSATIVACTHYKAQKNVSGWLEPQPNVCTFYAGTAQSNIMYIRDTRYTTIEEFKAYLAAQYAAGTPVTVWHVLATAETAAVNEPLMKIGNYSDTLSNATAISTTDGANSITVDTTVQPSEFTATWTGWHNAMVKEWDGSQWNE